MQLRHTGVWSPTFATLIAIAMVGLLIVAFCVLEFLYAKHYFAIQSMWYEISFPWNRLSFAFLNRFPEEESTLLVSGLSGIGGATVWWSMSRLAYSSGVFSSLVGSFIISYITSLMAWSATFSELLVIQVSQAFVLMAFFTLVPLKMSTYAAIANDVKTRRGPRFSLLDLLILVALISGLMVVVKPALINKFGYINLWLPILGASTGVVTLLFLLSYQASVRSRVVFLALCIPSAVAFGYGLASAFPNLRILWSFYTGAYEVGTFHYFPPAYMAWFMLTGLLSVAAISLIQIATCFASRLPGSWSRVGWPTTEACEVISPSR